MLQKNIKKKRIITKTKHKNNPPPPPQFFFKKIKTSTNNNNHKSKFSFFINNHPQGHQVGAGLFFGGVGVLPYVCLIQSLRPFVVMTSKFWLQILPVVERSLRIVASFDPIREQPQQRMKKYSNWKMKKKRKEKKRKEKTFAGLKLLSLTGLFLSLPGPKAQEVLCSPLGPLGSSS